MSQEKNVGHGPDPSAKAGGEEEYWTEERRARAIPVPLATESKKDQPGKAPAATPTGEIGHTRAGHG
jgi:hypothetical protein